MAQDARDLLEARLRDHIRLSQRRPSFLGFLNESQCAACEDLLRRERGVQWLLWGGWPEGERKLLGLFPDYLEPERACFPLRR